MRLEECKGTVSAIHNKREGRTCVMTGWDLYDHSFLFFSFSFFPILFWINCICIIVIVMTILHLLCTCHGACGVFESPIFLVLISP
ncbi:hypothetical protein BDV34DRAFT_135910 [Aspergillus parasiticus]|uniref:Transmembrane protein n=1 Tax=Aspergillus parasiticus TaxID=5067 RepID=A0A5N6DDR2_ASPPA|nr:hypothetical protein BDV34DRAFT_135910 [Aspergillus parasiticus]